MDSTTSGTVVRSRSESRLLWLGILLTATLVVLRLAVAPFQWGLWAEDGAVFLADAWTGGGSPTAAYAGYLHVAARVLAALVAALPVPFAALAVTTISAAVAALCAYFCARRLRHVLTGRWSRWIFAGFFIASPAAMDEVAGNLANLHWMLTAAAVIALWAPADTSGWRDYAGAAVCAAAALSSPLAVLAMAPVAMRAAGALMAPESAATGRARATGREFARVALPFAVLVTGLAVQASAVTTSTRSTGGTPDIGDFLYLWGAYSGPRLLLGYPLGSTAGLIAPALLVLIGALAIVVGVWLVAIVRLPQLRFGGLVPVVLLSTAVPLALNWNPELLLIAFPHGTPRYVYVGAVLTLLPALAIAERKAQLGRLSIVGAGATGLMLLGTAAGLAYGTSLTRSWEQDVASVGAECSESEVVVHVPIDPAGWTSAVPCDRIDAER